MADYFEIGKITGSRGLKGELRVYPLTDDPQRFTLLRELDIFTGKTCNTYNIERVWFQNGMVILKLTGVDDIDQAQKFKDAIIKIPPEKALPLEDDEYYLRDLYEMKVITEDGEVLGELTDVIHTGANDVYEVTDSEKKLLIPAIKDCIINVDIANKQMTVSLLKGLRDL